MRKVIALEFITLDVVLPSPEGLRLGQQSHLTSHSAQ